MDSAQLLAWVEANARLDFVRSSGPGGQNVNKVNSACVLHLDLAGLPGLDPEGLGRLRERLGGRVNASGELVVQARESRDQPANRAAALSRARDLIQAALRTPRSRRPTKPTRASRERRLDAKSHAAAAKRDRRRPDAD